MDFDHDPTASRRRRRPRVSMLRLALMSSLAVMVGAITVGFTTLFPDARAQATPAHAARLLPSEQLLEIERGARLRILGDDGVLAEGEFLGVSDDLDSAYAARLKAAGPALAALGLPVLGESVSVAPRSARGTVERRVGTFAGFDYRGVRLLGADGRVSRVDMSNVDSLWRADGHGVSGSDLAQWDADHLLPSLTTLVIRPSAHDADGRPHTDRSRVPWESARTVQPDRAPPSHTGDAIAAGVIAGVVVGALVIWYIGYSISSSIDECGSNFSQVRASAMPCDLHHVHRAEYDFDRYAGAYVEPEAALAAR